MRQRVLIAMALACQPELLIADEPTTALDVTIQAQILDLIRRMREETRTSVILITHDLGVVAGMADDVLVMYAGRVFERAPARALFGRPGNPYTQGLLRSVPDPARPDRKLDQIPGRPPDLTVRVAGCPFEPRCSHATDTCRNEAPPFVALAPDHYSLCHYAAEVQSSGGKGRPADE
jgi:oligopeptide/dipeptide ABC transporter ATP-binding protein